MHLLLLVGLVFLWGRVAQPATIYVDGGCGNVSTYVPGTRACTGGSSTVTTTFDQGFAAMAPGDTLYVREGFYGAIKDPPSGTGASNRTVISAYPINRTCSGNNPADVRTCCGSTYEAAVFRPNTSDIVAIRGYGSTPGPVTDRKWVTIEGIQIDGSSGGGNGISVRGGGALATNYPACDNGSHGAASTPDHIRILNVEVRNTRNQGYLGEQWNDNMEIICSWFHHNGRDNGTDHGIYLAGTDNWVYGNLIENNKTYGIHLYSQPVGSSVSPQCDPFGANTLIENNLVRGNRDGIGVLRGHYSTTVRNNLVYGNTEFGIHLNTALAGNSKTYNNTSVANGSYGLYLGSQANNNTIKNNIYSGLYQTAGLAGIVFANNYNVCSTCAVPDFVNAPAGDYHLQAGDARIDAGADLTSEGVTVDFDGRARPAGASFDIGAFEFNGAIPNVDFAMTNGGDISVTQGASVDADITLTTIAGTPPAATLTAEGLPANTTASFSVGSCAPNCASTLTLTAANTTPQGTYQITVRGNTGTGGLAGIQRTTSFILTVSCN